MEPAAILAAARCHRFLLHPKPLFWRFRRRIGNHRRADNSVVDSGLPSDMHLFAAWFVRMLIWLMTSPLVTRRLMLLLIMAIEPHTFCRLSLSVYLSNPQRLTSPG